MADKCLFSGGYGGYMADILLPMNNESKESKMGHNQIRT